MNINGISSNAHAANETHRQDEQLKQACRDFEGLFLSIILKEGMKPGIEPSEGNPSESGASMQELAIEQAAYDLGSKGTLGLADLLYEQMTMFTGRNRHD
jgi:flagellar protein FlgJ